MIFAKKLIKFVDKPYKTGGNNQQGYDCLGLVADIQDELGKKFPRAFGEWNETNYAELYMNDRPKAEEVMIEFFDSFAKRVPVNRVLAGDIIVVRFKVDNERMPGVYVGNGNFISSFTDGGVKVFTIDQKKIEIVGAWRIE